MSKLDTALRLWSEGGIRNVAQAAAWRLSRSLHAAYQRLQGWWRFTDHWFVGKWVELRGNLVVLDGCRFSLDHPSITTRLKSRFVLGTYEFRERHAVAQFLDPGIPVVELGGGIGVVSCIVNKRLRHPDRHVVVEANAELVPQIERNRKINGCSFVVRHLALGYGGSVVEFSLAASYLESGVGLQGCRTVAVPASTLAGILDSQGFGQATLVCDIEGAEFGLLRHEAAVLTKRVPMIIIEGHDVPGVGSRADFKAGVLGLGFRCLSEGGRTWVFAKDPGPSPAQ